MENEEQPEAVVCVGDKMALYVLISIFTILVVLGIEAYITLKTHDFWLELQDVRKERRPVDKERLQV